MTKEVKILSQDGLLDLQNRFGSFHDAVVHQIICMPFRETRLRKMEIRLGVREVTNNHWFNVTFELYRPLYYVVRLWENYSLGVISNLNIHFSEEIIFLDFFPTTNQIDNVKEFYKDLFNKASSPLMVACYEAYWYVSEYNDAE